MKPMTAVEVAVLAGAGLVRGDPATVVRAVTTDSRSVPAGALFVALRGDRFDGHEFVAAAGAAGAAAVLVEAVPALPPGGMVVLQAPDSLAALQRLAGAVRRLLDPRVVAVTGSNGKTTTKDFIRAVLSSRYAVNATEGNLNNHIGLPLTLLKQTAGQTHGVFELGMNHPGEVAALAALAAPDIGVITNVGTAHIEYFGTIEAIAAEKASLFSALRPDGVAVLNLESPMVAVCRARAPGRVVEVGKERGDVRAEQIHFDETGAASFTVRAEGASARVVLPVPGAHMVHNALLALAVGWIEGVSLEQGAAALASAKLAIGRLTRRVWRGVTLLDDSYNANPDSMVAALQTLSAVAATGRRIAVLGAMGELGGFAAAGYRRVGRATAAEHIDLVCTVGDGVAAIADEAGAAGVATASFATHAECARWLGEVLRPGDVVLVKGSRLSAMEQILSHLEEVPS